MIALDTRPPGGFGNRLFTYNAVFQIADTLNIKANFSKIDDDIYFPNLRGEKLFTWFYPRLSGSMISEIGKERIFEKIKKYGQVRIIPPFLGDTFFSLTKKDPRDYLKLKIINDHGENRIALHFRGGDFFSWNPRAVLDAEYYINALKIQQDITKVEIFSDDWTLESIKEVVKWLEHKRIQTVVHQGKSFFEDFVEMANCDVLVSSPSTFAIWAGILGKRKKIIHSTQWLDYCIEEHDKFWIDLRNGGNQFYRIDTEV